MDPKVSKEMPVYKETSGGVNKWKCGIISKGFEYKMLMLDTEKGRVGDTNDWKQAKSLLEEHGMLTRPEKDGPLVYLGKHKFGSYKEFWAWMKSKDTHYDEFLARVVTKVFTTPIALPDAEEEEVE
jgi:hypothetical protein